MLRLLMRQLRFLALLTLCIGFLPLASVVMLEFLAVKVGAQDEGLGDYFMVLYFVLLGLGAYLFVRFFDRR